MGLVCVASVLLGCRGPGEPCGRGKMDGYFTAGQLGWIPFGGIEPGDEIITPPITFIATQATAASEELMAISSTETTIYNRRNLEAHRRAK